MSSCVIVRGSEGFVVSTDSIVIKSTTVGQVKGLTRKLFRIRPGLIAAALGNWNSYFPILNSAARMNGDQSEVLTELRSMAIKAKDIHLYILFREEGDVILDGVEAGELTEGRTGVVAYPEKFLMSLFAAMYESPEAMEIRQSGMLGMAAIVNGYNAFAEALSINVSSPYDTILFLKDGSFAFSGGVTDLPVGEFG